MEMYVPNYSDIVGNRNINFMLERAAERAPEATFCINALDGQVLSYRGLIQSRNRCVLELEQFNIKHRTPVIIHTEKTLRQIVLMFALYKLGAVAIMSNPVNTNRELKHIIKMSQASTLIIDDDVDAITRKTLMIELKLTNVVSLQKMRFLSNITSESGGPIVIQDDSAITPDSPATMLFTSGTTANPKAVVYKHGHHVLGAELYVSRLGMHAKSLLMHHFPLFHMNGLNQLMATILASGSILLVDRFRSERFDQLIDKYHPTVTYLNGTHIKMIRQCNTHISSRSSLESVGMALQMKPSDYDWFIAVYGDILAEGYGATETIGTCLGNPQSGKKRGSCGLPNLNYLATLRKTDGSECAVDEIGELWIKSMSPWGLFHGYVSDPEATALVLRDGWYHTGDLLRKDADGYLYFVDRLKDVIKRAGENISAREIEVVLESYPDVQEAAVIGRTDELREEIPVAFVIPNTERLSIEKLKLFCAERLAKYKIPSVIHVVSSLPKNSVGKVVKRTLKAQDADGSVAELH